MMSEKFDLYSEAGIVDKVRAIRNNAGEVLRLDTTVRIVTPLETTNYGQETNIDEITIGMPVDAGVNPGDIVAVRLHITSPSDRRFQQALDVGGA